MADKHRAEEACFTDKHDFAYGPVIDSRKGLMFFTLLADNGKTHCFEGLPWRLLSKPWGDATNVDRRNDMG
ncbi:hypothetical protein U1Q18_029702 [Sarracenia purpurea var. burkii]